MNAAPPGPPRRGPGPHTPPFRLDREKTCPLLLRVFPRLGGHHTAEDFPIAGPLPASEFQIYTWPDATLGELAELVRAVPPARDKLGARLSFSLVYPDRSGRPAMRQIGHVLGQSQRGGGEDAGKTLHEVRFQTGDYLDVAVLEHRS